MFEPEPWDELLLVWDWVEMAGNTVSGEKTRGLGGWRRGRLDSDMNKVVCPPVEKYGDTESPLMRGTQPKAGGWGESVRYGRSLEKVLWRKRHEFRVRVFGRWRCE